MRVRGQDSMSQPMSAADLERRDRFARVRAAARHGKPIAEIAALCRATPAEVRLALGTAEHVRISNPAQLLQARQPAPGAMPPDVQMYWVGFLTAAGRLCGQGAAFTLVVTLGNRSQADMDTFTADLAGAYVRYEFCHSSLAGWQLYVRDEHLCKALLPWGIPSDRYGEAPALLDELPDDLITPFVRGYLDGDRLVHGKPHRGTASALTLHGTPAVLAGINNMVQRCWHVPMGTVTAGTRRATLRFADPQTCAVIWDRVHAYPSRLPVAAAEASPG